jgi:RHS repeat-associated protein
VTQAVNSAVRQYSYDLTDQLTNSTGASSYSATCDAVGNRLTADGRGYTVNNLNACTQLTAPAQTLSYDANGNISSWDGTNFFHDSQGQLTNLTAGSQSIAYQYDHRRLRVTGGTAAYTYDAGGNLRQIADGGNITQYVYADGIDHAVLLRRNGTLYALITGHLGSVVAILNSTGNLVQSYDYTPFGRTTATGTDVGNVLGFTGREYDPASGLYYYRNRWYSPDLGRFLEPDPIGLRASDVNLYRYVGNNPLNLVDPLGLDYLDCLATCIQSHDPLNLIGKLILSAAGGTIPYSWVSWYFGAKLGTPLTTVPSMLSEIFGMGAGNLARLIGRAFSPLFIGYGLYLAGVEVYCAGKCARCSS